VTEKPASRPAPGPPPPALSSRYAWPAPDTPADTATGPADAFGPVTVAGAGLTGASWAGLFAAAGFPVRLFDVHRDALDPALEGARAAAAYLAANGLADAEAVEHGLELLTATTAPAAAFTGVAHVQECVREDLETKRELFALADRLAPPDALVATSSSGLSISEIQTAAASPQRTLAAHPYNPPHLVPLVELAPGALTAPDTLERARRFYVAAGKEPVVLGRDIPGYIVNRISAALWREAIELVRSGVVSVADLDKAICSGPGLRWAAMGPHLIYDLGGGRSGIRGHVEHLAAVKEGMLRDLATWVEIPPDTADVLAAGLPQEKADLLSGAGAAADADEYDELCRLRDELLAAFVRERRRVLGGPPAG